MFLKITVKTDFFHIDLWIYLRLVVLKMGVKLSKSSRDGQQKTTLTIYIGVDQNEEEESDIKTEREVVLCIDLLQYRKFRFQSEILLC